MITESYLEDIADAIREKKGVLTTYYPSQMAEAISTIVGGTPVINSLNVTPSTSQQTFDSSSVDGYKPVTVDAMPSMTLPTSAAASATTGYTSKATISKSTSDQYINIPTGYNAAGAYYKIDAVPNGTAGTPSASKGSVSNHSITVTPSVTNTTGYITGGTKTGTGVTVSANELVSGTLSINSNGTKDVTNYASVNVNVGSSINNQDKSVTPTESEQSITADEGYTGLGTVTVDAISDTYVGSRIVRRSSTDLTTSGATVSVPSGYYAENASKTITSGSATAPASISGTAATVSTGINTLTLSKTVSVTPSVSAGYVSSGTAGNSAVSLTASVPIDPTPTASGATVTIPTGYYSEQTTKSVSSGSATGPSSLSGSSANISTDNNTLTLTKTGVTTTPTVNAGYISSGTASSATVTLTASATIDPTPTTSGATVTIPAGYYTEQTTKAVSSGSATAPATISGTAATVSTGTNTLTLSKTVSVTPTVSAGYISSGTAGNSAVSLTANVTTKAATTYHPSTSSQSIASRTYLTGAQTISPVTTTNLSASNIVSGVTIKVGDSSDDDCVASVTGNVVLQNYYTGSSAPSSSLGSNGDLYLQS